MNPTHLLVDAIERVDTRFLAAAARVGASLPSSAEPALRALADHGLDVTVANDELIPVASPDLRLAVEGDTEPVALTTTSTRRTMLAAVICCWQPGARHPWPGRASTVERLLTLTPENTDITTKAALRSLARWRLIDLATDTTVHEQSELRLGPLVATWTGRWVEVDLPALVARITGTDPTVAPEEESSHG